MSMLLCQRPSCRGGVSAVFRIQVVGLHPSRVVCADSTCETWAKQDLLHDWPGAVLERLWLDPEPLVPVDEHH